MPDNLPAANDLQEAFVDLLRVDAVDSTARSFVRELQNPERCRSPDVRRIGVWYQSLDVNARSLVDTLVKEMAHFAVFNCCCALDNLTRIVVKGVDVEF